MWYLLGVLSVPRVQPSHEFVSGLEQRRPRRIYPDPAAALPDPPLASREILAASAGKAAFYVLTFPPLLLICSHIRCCLIHVDKNVRLRYSACLQLIRPEGKAHTHTGSADLWARHST